MNDSLETIAVIAELFTWIGLLGGALCLLLRLIISVVGGSWSEAHAVVVDDENGSLLRWMTQEGEIHEARLTDAASLGDPDELQIYFKNSSPDTIRFERHSHLGQVLLTLAIILLALGTAAAIASIIVMFVAN